MKDSTDKDFTAHTPMMQQYRSHQDNHLIYLYLNISKNN